MSISKRRLALPGAAVLAATLLLVGCEPAAPPPAPAPVEDDGANGDDEVALAPACAELEPPPYDPPADEQPDPDPALTTTAPLPDDLPLDGDEPEDEDGDDPDADRDDDGTVAAPDQPPLDAMSAARQWAEDEAVEHFAGMWIDPDAHAPVIAFTDEVEELAEVVRDRFGEGWWVVRLEHSYAELRAVQDQIVRNEMVPPGDEDALDDPEDHDAAGDDRDDVDGPAADAGKLDGPSSGEDADDPAPVHGVGFRDPLNRLILMIDGPTEERIAELSERYGADLLCWEDTPAADTFGQDPATAEDDPESAGS